MQGIVEKNLIMAMRNLNQLDGFASWALMEQKAAMATSTISISGSRVVRFWSARFGFTNTRTSFESIWEAVHRIYSYEIPAITGISNIRLANLHQIDEIGPNNVNNSIEIRANVNKNAVPQRACCLEWFATNSGVNSVPASYAFIVLCSAPW